ncbi:type VI secretion system tube protein Hcp [Subtercola sp. PAMC28395]|uniref:type VI secretion system tube protein Hcp n=1 Tax=Subtercola sp. PAMC28395 TaxID=2846775 RepID=UPI001C0C0075|nr:type VI secretion system tube protein Hcp [Subtercola sp. PAMC28395]QWT23598.1 type VI secretion system tube protein Hcp [Subtercola sp. PAMC28395]
MPSNMFASFSSIPVDSSSSTTDKQFANKAFEISNFVFGASNSGSTHVGSGGGAGKVNVRDISFDIKQSNLSISLFIAIAKGTHIPTATVWLRNPNSVSTGTTITGTTYELSDVLVTSLAATNAADAPGLETVTLNFARIRITNLAVGLKPSVAAWDITNNVAF